MDSFENYSGKIAGLYRLLNSRLKELSDLLHDIGGKAQIYELPMVTVDDEMKMYQKGRVGVEVTCHDDWLAFGSAISIYSEFISKENQSTRFSHRTPGFILLNEAPPESLFILLTRIQALKDEIKSEVQSYAKEPRKRHELLHDAIQGVISYQLYRSIPFISQKVNNISFRWRDKSVAPIMKKAETIEMLASTKHESGGVIDKNEWDGFIEHMITAVKFSPYNVFKRFKTHKRIPSYGYTYRGENGKLKQIAHKDATMPVLLLGNLADNPPAKVTPLDVPKEYTTIVGDDGWVQIDHNYPLYGKIRTGDADE